LRAEEFGRATGFGGSAGSCDLVFRLLTNTMPQAKTNRNGITRKAKI
jgi:hypothetical protein